MKAVKLMRLEFAVVVVAFLVLAVPETARPEDSSDRRPIDTGSQAHGQELDSQLLDGIDISPFERNAVAPEGSDRNQDPARRRSATGSDRFGNGSDVAQDNPLAQISHQMRQVEQMLNQRNVSTETLKVQRQIVDQLDELIDALAASRQSESQCESNSSSPDNQQATGTGREASRNGSGKSVPPSSNPLPGTATWEAIGDIWGHLPERFRNQVQNVEAIEFLPEYRRLIEDYYRRLAED